jgi:hypothetical protein
MIRIQRDNTQKIEKRFAVSDKGIIWGGSYDIVERKLKRLNAKEKIYGEGKDNARTNDQSNEPELPF